MCSRSFCPSFQWCEAFVFVASLGKGATKGLHMANLFCFSMGEAVSCRMCETSLCVGERAVKRQTRTRQR